MTCALSANEIPLSATNTPTKNLAGYLKTLPPNGPFPSNSFFGHKPKVAIIKTKCATIAFFSQMTADFDRLGFKKSVRYIQLFRTGLSEKCARDSPKVSMGYVQYTFPVTVAVKPAFVAFLYHSQTYVHGFSCPSFKFLWKTVNSTPPTIPFAVVASTLSDNLSRNGCMHYWPSVRSR